jgi:hypothetical protein
MCGISGIVGDEALSTQCLTEGGILRAAAARQIWERFQRSPDMMVGLGSGVSSYWHVGS